MEAGGQKFKVIISHIRSSRPAWTSHLVSNKTKHRAGERVQLEKYFLTSGRT